MKLIRIIISLVLLAGIIIALSGCASNLGTIRSDEARQTAAMRNTAKAQNKKDADVAAKFGAVANLAAQVKFLLKLPETDKTVPVENQLLDEQLTLTGAPSERESVLEAEVNKLLENQKENEAAMLEIQKRDKAVNAALDSANQEIAKYKGEVLKTTATLYSAAEFTAIKADEFNGFVDKLWMALYVVAGVIGILIALWLFEKFGKSAIVTAAQAAGAAAKAP